MTAPATDRPVRLRVRSWGSGPRTAVLIHGFSDDAGTWCRVGPALAAQGFTVLAPDLRGHGESPRCASYTLPEIAHDLPGALPAHADLVVGHSLGALALGLVADVLQPARLVYVDPPWLRTRADFLLPDRKPTSTEDLPPQLASWDPSDVDAELASNACLDPLVARSLLAGFATDEPLPVPPAAVPGAVVLVPERDPALPLHAHDRVRALGYTIRTLADVAHVMHRDDLDGFLALLHEQLDGAAPASPPTG